MRKEILIIILAIFCGTSRAWSYSFSAPCPTGQMLYYNIIDAEKHYVELTYPSTTSAYPWQGYVYPSGTIELPMEVRHGNVPYLMTAIGKHAFKFCEQLKGDLILPESITAIGEYAFYGCTGFTGNLYIPNCVSTIGAQAFYECSGLSGELNLPNSVSEIGMGAFYKCSGLRGDLVLPYNLSSIKTETFYGCTGFM